MAKISSGLFSSHLVHSEEKLICVVTGILPNGWNLGYVHWTGKYCRLTHTVYSLNWCSDYQHVDAEYSVLVSQHEIHSFILAAPRER